MKVRHYAILLVPDLEEGGYSVTVPSLPGCVTQGDTLEEAIAMARDAISVWITVAEKHGEPIPEEMIRPQAITLDIPEPVAAA
jgi:predicted RNase H-like HicB family nuclease